MKPEPTEDDHQSQIGVTVGAFFSLSKTGTDISVPKTTVLLDISVRTPGRGIEFVLGYTGGVLCRVCGDDSGWMEDSSW